MKLRQSIVAGLMGWIALAGTVSAHEYFAPNFVLFHPWAVASQDGQTDVPVYFTTREVEEGDTCCAPTRRSPSRWPSSRPIPSRWRAWS